MTSASTYSEQEPASNDDAGVAQSPETATQPLPAVETLPKRQPSGLEEECFLHGLEPPDEGLRVFLSQLALKQIATHSKSNLPYYVNLCLMHLTVALGDIA